MRTCGFFALHIMLALDIRLQLLASLHVSHCLSLPSSFGSYLLCCIPGCGSLAEDYAAMSSGRRQRSRSPMFASLVDGIAASAGTLRRSSGLSSVSYSSTVGSGHGTAVDIPLDAESSDCSLFDQRFASSSSSPSHSIQNEVAHAEFLWNSPLSSPRPAGDVSDAEPAISMRLSSGECGYVRRCASPGSSAVMVVGGSQCCHLCCRDRLMANSDQPVCFAGRYLGRQLSDSVLPDDCSEQQPSSSSADRVAAPLRSSAARPFVS